MSKQVRKASNPRLILLSGPLCAGKTTLGVRLAHSQHGDLIRVRELIRDLTDVDFSRQELLKAGAHLERTAPSWLAKAIRGRVDGTRSRVVIVDSIRTVNQARSTQAAFPRSTLIHVTANRAVRVARFSARSTGGFVEARTFESAEAEGEEALIARVGALADWVLDTTHLSPDAALTATLAFLATP
ncbi:MAG: AAA family ATPase [Candidatus Dormibacteria bacterium]